MREKILLNSIPVYRIEKEDCIEYRLFENTDTTIVININKINSLGKQLDIVFKQIQESTDKLRSINCIYKIGIDDYEQIKDNL